MKYEVIGWTYCGDQKYKPHEKNTCSVDNAIIKEIRKHGYSFGGDRHEDYCPILNDGTYADYSWRGWGRIMAMAHDIKYNDGSWAYMCYYMDSLIKPKFRKYPERSHDEYKYIVPKETLAETFIMHLSPDMFEAMKAGSKTVEIRLFDDKRKLVDIGDYIEFRNSENKQEKILRRVTDIEISKTFEELFESIVCPEDEPECAYRLKCSPKQLGACSGSDIKSLVEGIYKYYSAEQEKEFGVMALKLESAVRKPLCKTYLLADYYFDELAEYDFTNLSQKERTAAYDAGDKKGEDFKDAIEKYIIEQLEVIPVQQNYYSYIIGSNENYNVNVNEMLRITLGELINKVDKLREFSEKFYTKEISFAAFTLVIEPYLLSESNEQKQALSLDRDMIEFLYKSGVKIDLRYNTFDTTAKN